MLLTSGTLDISTNDFKENALFFLKDITIGDKFDEKSVNSTYYKDIPIYGAISSTITNLYNKQPVKELENENVDKKKYIALDMGHHQYSGRYMLSIQAAHNFLKTKYNGKHLVLLSFWRFNKGNTKSNWYYSNLEIKKKRINSDNDFIDILEYDPK